MKRKSYYYLHLSILIVLFTFFSVNAYRAFYPYHSAKQTYSNLVVSQSNKAVHKESINVRKLQETHEDIIGWFQSNDSKINYPVVQSQDNDYYLSHLIDHQENGAGAIFLDYRNNQKLTDQNSVIYGHNMLDQSMFSALVNYQKQDYYDKNQTLQFYSLDSEYQIQIFAAVIESGDHEFVEFNFPKANDFKDYLAAIRQQTLIKSDVIVSESDQILTLITCTDYQTDERLAVYGKIIKIGS